METLFKILGGVFVALFAALIAIPMMLVTVVPLAALDGWIMHLAWGWFMVPTFGLPQLAWAMATGIVLLISWTTFQLPATKDEVNNSGTSRILTGAAVSLGSWFMMWCTHLYIIH